MSRPQRNDIVYAVAVLAGAVFFANLLVFGVFFLLKAWLHWTPPRG